MFIFAGFTGSALAQTDGRAPVSDNADPIIGDSAPRAASEQTVASPILRTLTPTTIPETSLITPKPTFKATETKSHTPAARISPANSILPVLNNNQSVSSSFPTDVYGAIAAVFGALVGGYLIFKHQISKRNNKNKNDPCGKIKIKLDAKEAKLSALKSGFSLKEIILNEFERKLEKEKNDIIKDLLNKGIDKILEFDESGKIKNTVDLAEEIKKRYDDLVDKYNKTKKAIEFLKQGKDKLEKEVKILKSSYGECIASRGIVSAAIDQSGKILELDSRNTDTIIIVGAGACGLMAGRKLSQAGKKVIILEARDRIGGRIWSLPEDEFGYPAQGGAEFVHGEAPITKALAKEAGLTFVSVMDGEIWNSYGGALFKQKDFLPSNQEILFQKLKELEKDMPIADFLDEYFVGDEFKLVRKLIIGMVEGYDAADPDKISSFSLREEWLNKDNEWEQGKIIKEGYGALLNFLKTECLKNGAEIKLNSKVDKIDFENKIKILCHDGAKYEASGAIVTVALPTIGSIKFNPAISEKLKIISRIGFGNVIKILMRFDDEWWFNVLDQNLKNLGFLRSDEEVPIWWTQYPDHKPVLTGWLAGPDALRFKDKKIMKLLIQPFVHCLIFLKLNKIA